MAQRQFAAGAERVFVARADVFADALAAGSVTGGPVLLVPSCGLLPPAVTDEIARLNPRTVIALGGEAAVCQPLLDVAAAGRAQGRLAGASRFDTAVANARAQFPDGASQVYLGRASDSPDAVAGGTLTGGPILLVPSSGPVPEEVVAEVARLGAQRVAALGGSVAVSDDVVAQIAGGLPSVRLAGADRFATAAAISAFEFAAGSEADSARREQTTAVPASRIWPAPTCSPTRSRPARWTTGRSCWCPPAASCPPMSSTSCIGCRCDK